MKTISDSVKDEVLYAFSVEYNENVEVLDEYLRKYPQYSDELIDLSIELLAMPVNEEVPVGVEINESVERSWGKFQSVLSPSDPISLVERIDNPLVALDQKKFSSVANKLNISRLFLTRLRDRTIEVSTLPVRFIETVANAVEVDVETMRASLTGASIISTATSFKAKGKPVAKKQMTFEEAIKSSNLSEEQMSALIAMKD